jgi:hypothetical protein
VIRATTTTEYHVGPETHLCVTPHWAARTVALHQTESDVGFTLILTPAHRESVRRLLAELDAMAESDALLAKSRASAQTEAA